MAISATHVQKNLEALAARVTTIEADAASADERLTALEAAPAPIPPEPVPLPGESDVASLTLTVSSLATAVGRTTQINAVAWDANGNAVPGVPVAWTSSSPSVATVDVNGVVAGVAAGTSTITGNSNGKTASTTVTVSAPTPNPEAPPVLPPVIIQPPDGGVHPPPYPIVVVPGTPPPTPPEPSEFVTYPSANVAFICGPQLASGSAANPWPWFDTNAASRGLVHGAAYPGELLYENHYYDLTLTLYIEYYRTGIEQYRTYARAVGDSWYAGGNIAGSPEPFSNSYISPRAAAHSGLMLRALDGRPEMWPGITMLARGGYEVWLGVRLANPVLHEGIRDGGILLRGLAEIGKAHPDAGIRAEFTAYALAAAKDYYARLQKPDGGWYWTIGVEWGGLGPAGDTSQPMMAGMLLEGLIATHQLTGDATVAQSILRAVDWLWDKGYDRSEVTNIPGLFWRSMRYFVHEGQPLSGHGSALLYGMQDGAVRDERQLNPEALHAFGYAFKLTGDAAYLTRGDEIFASTYGNGQGPGADAYSGLAHYRAKEYNVSYRSGGRYLAWRAGA